MPQEVLMPALSSSMSEGRLARWLTNVGESVRVGDILAEIETDKATLELPSEHAGILHSKLVADGTDGVIVGAPIAVLLLAGEKPESIGNPPMSAAPPIVTASAIPPTPDSVAPGVRVEVPEKVRIFASPLAKVIARDNGLDLTGQVGSGPHNRIRKVDVLALIDKIKNDPARVEPMSAPPAAQVEKPTHQPAPMPWQNHVAQANTTIRKTIARRLTESKQRVPHFYLTAAIDLENLLAARAKLNARLGEQAKLSINDFVIKASAAALRQVPQANAMWTDEAILNFEDVDISVAVSTDSGLITPVIRQADRKGLTEISTEMRALAAAARSGKLTPEQYQGGGFSISNLGMFGVEQFSAIINPPQSCILAVGMAEQRAVVRDGIIAIRTMMTATLSVDHRSVDGAVGAQLLAAVKATLEEPLSMIL